MMVDHFVFSTSGGAGKVASLLVHEQSRVALDVKIHSVTSTNLWDNPWRHPFLTLRAAFDLFVVSAKRDGPLFSFARRGGKWANSDARPGSIIHLHWTEGMLSREQVLDWLESGRRIVFTLHDMAPFTGGCHFSLGCTRFQNSCEECPLVRRPFRNAIEKNFKSQPSLLKYKEQVACVAPSEWMRDQATLSQAFSGIPVHVIENPIDPTFFESRDSALARKVMGIPLGHFVAITVAAQLDNPIKQVRSCIEAFNSACARLGVPGTYVLAGRGAEKFSSDFSNVLAVGSGDSKHVAKAMSAANVLISGSIAESAGMTIVEAAGQGIPSVVLSNGGSDSKILDGETGFLVKNFSEMTSCLVRMHSAVTSPGRGLRADKIKKKASIESSITHVSNQYTKIYEKLLS